ncbi:MAG: site-2 protease family protein [Frankiaceae bacterium]
MSIRGAPVYFSPFALLFAVIIGFSYGGYYAKHRPDLSLGAIRLMGAALAILFLASVLVHELGHALTARSMRLRVHAVTIHGFAGFTEYSPEAPTPGREFVVAVSGPVVNLIVGGGTLFAWQFQQDRHSVAALLLLDVARLNIILGVFNLLPGLPLDGGRVTSALVWKLSNNKTLGVRVAAYAGFVVAGLVVVFGAVYLRALDIWLLLVAAFIVVGAYSNLRVVQVHERVPQVTVAGLVRRTLVIDDERLPLAEAMRRAQEIRALGIVVADTSGRPQSVMVGAAADAVPEGRRPWVSLASVCRRVEPGLLISVDTAGEDLIRHLRAHPASEYVAVDQQGRVVGVLAAVDVAARLNVAGTPAAPAAPTGS